MPGFTWFAHSLESMAMAVVFTGMFFITGFLLGVIKVVNWDEDNKNKD